MRQRSSRYFGVLTYEEDLGKWTALVPGTAVALRLGSDEAEPSDAVLALAESFCRNLDEWSSRAQAHAAARLLSVKNDHWLADGESPVTAEAFCQRMVLEGVSLEADGDVEVFYEDGGLFAGHAILVSGTVERGPLNAQIAG